ncbi:MAG: DUF2254 domain-containing protein [Proteobacteria bacterium]|nr:DUF2254 domain-containing protein [Pseudomonadota bacterium]MDA1070109.1 DUF2254 domain-containing protein [Pseudomonadota bacterium]
MIQALLSRLGVLRYAVTRSFWFVPGLMTLGAIGLVVATRDVAGVKALETFFKDNDLIAAGPESTRTILATTVGSIITVTSLVFSMVLIALSRASQQLGPRLLQAFTGDKVNQVVLGAFVATFVHALLTLAMTPDPIPPTAVAVSIVLVLACFVLLVFFLHHTAQYMQADYVLARVNAELCAAIPTTFPEAGSPPPPGRPDWAGRDEGDRLMAPGSGYIQAVDYHRLLELAGAHDLRLRLDMRPGHFVLAGGVIGQIAPAGRCTSKVREEIADAIVIGSVRTAAQDLEFSIKAMVEIALRALSPGINDTYTAVAAIDQLGAALASAIVRSEPPGCFADGDGAVRLVCDRVTFESLLDAAYNPIRQNLAGNVTGIIRLVDMLGELAPFAGSPEGRQALLRHLDMTVSLAKRTVGGERDGADVAARASVARGALAPATIPA